MDISQIVANAQDAVTVRRVYGEPIEREGATVISAARVAGGGGGGDGREANGQEGEGAGFGIAGVPAGAFVIRDGSVRWVPAVNPGHMIATVAAAVVAVVVVRSWVATRAIRAGRTS